MAEENIQEKARLARQLAELDEAILSASRRYTQLAEQRAPLARRIAELS